MKQTGSDVVIVGAGVIGCAIADELSRRKVAVTLIDRGPIGREASWASAGIISLPNRPTMPPELVEISRLGFERYPALVAELEAETGVAIEFRRPGQIMVAVNQASAASARAIATWQQGLGFEVTALTVEEARRLEPTLSPDLQAAWFTPGVGSLSVYRLTQALAMSAARRGATILTDTPVGSLIRDGRRVTGVQLATGPVAATTVILAAGAWTRFLGETVGATVPTTPIKGQLLAFSHPTKRPTHLLSGHGGYVRPRFDGTTLVAATEEDVGFDRRVTGDGIEWLLGLTRTLCPVLLEGELVETWTGLRPGSATGQPVLGPVPGCDGLWVATSHFRTGAKEAPGTAMLIAESLTTGQLDSRLMPLTPPAIEVPAPAAVDRDISLEMASNASP